MKIRIEQLNPVVGDLNGNRKQILQSLARAESQGIGLLILPEMVLTGYPVQDLLDNTSFCEQAFEAAGEIVRQTSETALLFGSITRNDSGRGKDLFNSALLCRDGKFLGKADKTLLPNYDIFDESRYFEPNRTFNCLMLDDVCLGVTICEDIWYNESESREPLYRAHPARELHSRGAELLINISASPFTKGKHTRRLEVLGKRAGELGLPLLYSNQAGAQADVLFEGDSMALNAQGDLVALSNPFHPDFIDVGWSRGHTLQSLSEEGQAEPFRDPSRRLLEGITTGIRDYLAKTGASDRLILGLSGGIDSALVAVLAVEAAGPDCVMALTMPTEFSSTGSVSDSEKLAANLGIDHHVISVQELYESSLKTLSGLFAETSFGVAEENLQSRMRGALLMACSNKFGPLLLATGNKSELAVGYATIYGDMNGGLNPIGDLYKSEVFSFCRWLNESYYNKEVIPVEILEKPPSAELRPDQKDSDSLPPYKDLDEILYRYIEEDQDVDQIVSETSHPSELVLSVLKKVDLNEFKRFQAPPIIKLSSKSFGIGRRWPLVQGWTRNRKP